jgi:hypothetical protein
MKLEHPMLDNEEFTILLLGFLISCIDNINVFLRTVYFMSNEMFKGFWDLNAVLLPPH